MTPSLSVISFFPRITGAPGFCHPSIPRQGFSLLNHPLYDPTTSSPVFPFSLSPAFAGILVKRNASPDSHPHHFERPLFYLLPPFPERLVMFTLGPPAPLLSSRRLFHSLPFFSLPPPVLFLFFPLSVSKAAGVALIVNVSVLPVSCRVHQEIFFPTLLLPVTCHWSLVL
ncbi:hypothetical protein AVEN_15566-1 [Araneus ventricosus]|uniref:Uncharacterized protein n=1 Tax=Araneus ventricosus TaxID=182803 RepID=A0A4Y2FX45_ARAVE|nr:hypothetical protein AVEN_15566-1 [Araneus ventricosus]